MIQSWSTLIYMQYTSELYAFASLPYSYMYITQKVDF